FDLIHAFAMAGLATPTFDVERETSGHVASRFGLIGHGKDFAYHIEQTGVGSRVRARRAPDRRLVDVYYFVDFVAARYLLKTLGSRNSAVDIVAQKLEQEIVHQRGFSGTADTCDGNELVERYLDLDVLQIVQSGTVHFQRKAVAFSSFVRNTDAFAPAQIS